MFNMYIKFVSIEILYEVFVEDTAFTNMMLKEKMKVRELKLTFRPATMLH